MRIPNLPDEINLTTYAGAGETLESAIQDALEDGVYDSRYNFFVVIIKVLRVDTRNEVKNGIDIHGSEYIQ